MSLKLSLEQSTILDAAKHLFNNEDGTLIKISARSGSGKTFMLSTITAALLPRSGKYLAYNKSIATESRDKFPRSIDCSTTHSLAYGAVVRALNLEVGLFNYKSIRERIPFEEKIIVIEIIEKFCLSASTDIMTFNEEYYSVKHREIAKSYVQKMQRREIPCTHSFYLKLYQLSLRAGIIKPKKVDLLMLDEAGDVNEVTLDIFMHYPAKLKILVGDNYQNIYSFNGTINGFEALKDVGEYYELTQSFRVSSEIAKGVEKFCQKFLDKDVKFTGVQYRHSEINVDEMAYISRTNASMIDRMIKLDNDHIKYNLVRPVKSIFELVMILIYLKPNGEIFNAKYKFLQSEADDFAELPLQLRNTYGNSLLKYIAALNEEDVEIMNAINLINRFSRDVIMKTYNNALSHENHSANHKITLTTAHSSKGLEFQTVWIEDDLNDAVDEILYYEGDNGQIVARNFEDISDTEREELRLYYVAVTRCQHDLFNARFIELGTSDL